MAEATTPTEVVLQLTPQEVEEAIDDLRPELEELMPDWKPRFKAQTGRSRLPNNGIPNTVEDEFESGDTRYKVVVESSNGDDVSLGAFRLERSGPLGTSRARVGIETPSLTFAFEDNQHQSPPVSENKINTPGQIKILLDDFKAHKSNPQSS